MLTPKPYQIYKHFKGNCYQIICIATDSEDGEKVVVYQGLYAPYKIYSRKLDMFMEPVDRTKYPDASQEYRFELLDEDGFVVNINREENKETQEVNIIESDTNSDNNTELESNDDHSEVSEEKLDIKDKSSDFKPRMDEKKAEEIKTRREQAAMINPILAKFLDASSDDEQLEIVVKYREEITEDILVPMELSLGMEVGEGRLADRIFAIRNCLELKKRYERSNRNS